MQKFLAQQKTVSSSARPAAFSLTYTTVSLANTYREGPRGAFGWTVLVKHPLKLPPRGS